MKIAIFASAFHPSLGGVEEFCRQVSHEIKQRGHEVIILTNRWPRDLPSHEAHEGIDVFRLAFRSPDSGPKSKITYAISHSAICREVRRILSDGVDLIHVHCVSASAHYACWARRAMGLPLVVTMHGELSMDATGLFSRSRFARNCLSDATESADAITAISQHTFDEAEAFLKTSFGSRGRVIHNGIRVSEFDGVTPYQHSKPYIFALGRHVTQKGFDVLLRAFAKVKNELPSLDLLLAGDGPERESLQTLACDLGLTDRTKFVGRTDRAQTLSLFAGCDYFVLPSRHEPFGLVNLEAMASGKVVIASRTGGVPEFVRDGQDGILVSPGNVDELAAAIKRLANQPLLRDSMGASGRENANRFDWNRQIEKYLEVYRSVVTTPHPHPLAGVLIGNVS